MAGVREIAGPLLPSGAAYSLFQDSSDRIWVATVGSVGYLQGDKFNKVTAVSGGIVRAITEDSRGDLWIANQELGLFHMVGRGAVQLIPWSSLGHKDFVNAFVADSVRGGIWMGFVREGVAYFKDGQVRASYTATDGLGEGGVNNFQLDHDGTLWAATEGGLSRLKDGHIVTLNSKNGLPCDTVHWVIEDDDHSFWLYTACVKSQGPRDSAPTHAERLNLYMKVELNPLRG
jgi:ligand-binding sensor domain-containing protein